MTLPWHKFYHDSWLASPTRFEMNLAERGLYLDALMLNYSEGTIPADPAVLRRRLGVDEDDFKKAWPRVSARFEPHPTVEGRLTNPKAAQELARQDAYRERQTENARKGGRPKGATKKTTHRKPIGERRDSDGSAAGKPWQTHKEEEEEGSSKEEPSSQRSCVHECSWSEQFGEWWSLYPLKKGKGQAKTTYRRMIVEGTPPKYLGGELDELPTFEARHARLMATTAAWVRDEFTRRPKDKVPHGSTHLNSLDWLHSPRDLEPADKPEANTDGFGFSKTKMAWEA